MKFFFTTSFILFVTALFSQVSLVKDINSGPLDSYANANYACAGGVFYFNAKDETNGYQLWRSNGNESGTYLLKEFYQSPNNTLISGIAELNGNAFFVAGSTKRLWKSDGTTAGTVVIKDFDSSNFFDVPSFYRLGNYVYFNGAEDTNGQELWRTDGTPAGTVLIKDIFPFGNHSRPGNFGSYNGKLFFTARTQAEGFELWTSDGTLQGTTLLKDINPGANASSIRNLISTPIGVFFQANDGTNGAELWVSDGTPSGTHMVKNLNPDGDGFSSNQGTIIHAYGNGKVLFNGKTTATGNELFVTDGTETGTQLLLEFQPGGGSGLDFSQFFSFQGKVVFVGSDNQAGFEPWISDGTLSGTNRLKDINPGSGLSSPTDYTIHQNNLYFTAFADQFGRELWVSDGTEAGTTRITDIAPGAASPNMDNLGSCGNLLFFYANDGTHGSELFRLGTPSSNLISLGDENFEVCVFPNPAKDWFQLRNNDLNLQGSLLEIISLSGQNLRSVVIGNGLNHQDVSDLENGIYFLRIRIGDKLAYGKLIINK